MAVSDAATSAQRDTLEVAVGAVLAIASYPSDRRGRVWIYPEVSRYARALSPPMILRAGYCRSVRGGEPSGERAKRLPCHQYQCSPIILV